MVIAYGLMEPEIQRPAPPMIGEARNVRSLVLLGFSAYMLAFARRAFSAGIHVYVIDLVKQPRGFVRRSNSVEPEGITLDWSAVGTPAGLMTIHRFVNKVHADALLTTDDFTLTWLGKNRAVFEPDCRLMIPQPEALEPLLDKAHQIELARECDFDLLPTWTLSSAESIAAIPNSAFPVVVRPSLNDSARPIFKALVINDRVELNHVYTSTQWSRAPIAQPYRLGPNYVLHGVRAESGEMLAMQLFKAYRKYRGFTTSMTPVHMPAGLEKSAQRFVESAGLTGPFHFELLGSDTDDRMYFLEINCRLGGTTAKVMQLGFDEPGLMLEAFNLQPPRQLPLLRVYTRATTISLNLVQALDALRNRRDPLAYPQPSRLRTILAAIREALTVHDGLLQLHDWHRWLWLWKVRKETRT